MLIKIRRLRLSFFCFSFLWSQVSLADIIVGQFPTIGDPSIWVLTAWDYIAIGNVVATCTNSWDTDLTYTESYGSMTELEQAQKEGTLCLGAKPPSTGGRTFLEYCKDSKASVEIKKTVQAMKDAVRLPAADCDTAYVRLKESTTLSLSGKDIQDLAPFYKLPLVKTLMLDNNRIRNVGLLASLPRLQKLVLRQNKINFVEHLAELKELKFLSIGLNAVQDLEQLAALTRLEILHFEGQSASDWSFLGQFTELNYLTLDGCNIEDLSSLSSMSKLRTLYMQGAQVSNVRPLVQLSQLTTIEADNMPLGTTVAKNEQNCPTREGSEELKRWCTH